jgi:hypothetical protein
VREGGPPILDCKAPAAPSWQDRASNHSQFFACCMFFCKRKQVTIQEAYVHGQKAMGRANQRLSKLNVGSPEDRCFRASFGVSAEVAVEAWAMMADHECLPPNTKFLHYLWALAFMQMYPVNDTALSTMLGGKDPKTINKYVWPFIQSLFLLNETVVSLLSDCCLLITL